MVGLAVELHGMGGSSPPHSPLTPKIVPIELPPVLGGSTLKFGRSKISSIKIFSPKIIPFVLPPRMGGSTLKFQDSI